MNYVTRSKVEGLLCDEVIPRGNCTNLDPKRIVMLLCLIMLAEPRLGIMSWLGLVHSLVRQLP